MFLLEHGSGPCRALALALQCLILLDHVGVQQGLQACVPVGGSLGQDRLIARRSAHARTDCAPPRILCTIDGEVVLVFDTGATNFFLIVPTLTVPTVGFFLESKAVKHVNREVEWRVPLSESGEV